MATGAALPPTIVVEDVDGCEREEPPTEDDMEARWIPLDPYYKHRHLRRGSDISTVAPSRERQESRVLVLYTGGTIGMKRETNGVYRPAPHLLEETIRHYPRLNDIEYGRQHFGDHSPQPLVLPDCGEAKRVIYTVYEFDPLLDSSNMTMDDWIRIATEIHEHDSQTDGFVILHGTDTMAYTASALSFMLEHLNKPVIITGSQIPIFETRTDAQANLLGALILAGNYAIPEVALFFNNKLLRGNRSVKTDAGEFNAFNSPSLDPLVTFGTDVIVNQKLLCQPVKSGKFTINTKLSRNVGLLRLFPSITLEMVQIFLRPPLKGVVLQTYGNGNAPSNRPDILREMKRATDNGIIIVNITQCYRGYVQNSYETGQVLIDVGVIPGFDMTPEAALTKLSYVLGQDCSLDEKIKMMKSNLRGEMTMGQKNNVSAEWLSAVNHSSESSTSEEFYNATYSLLTSVFGEIIKNGTFPTAELLRKQGMKIVSGNSDPHVPFCVSEQEGQKDHMEFLLQHETEKETRCPPFTNSSKECGCSNYDRKLFGAKLCSLAEKGDIQNLCLYKLAGIDLDQPDSFGRTALQVAIANKQTDCAHFLLDQGCGGIHIENISEKIKRRIKNLTLFI